MQIARYALAAFVVGMTAGMAPSGAEEVRRLGLSEVITDSTRDGIPLDEPIRARVGGVLFQMPAGFLAPWPSLKMRKVINTWQGIGFNFWMPERRYVEIDEFSLFGFRPTEPGRDYDPASNPFVVKVRGIRSIKPAELGTLSPETRFRNLTSWASASYSFEDKFGLVRFWRNNGPEAFFNYKHVDGSDPQVIARCTVVKQVPPGPFCQLIVYSVADELHLYVDLAHRDLPRWRESILAAIDLYKSWKVTAQ